MYLRPIFSDKCPIDLLALPLISLITVPHMNSKMVDNFLIKIHLESIPKRFERISFLNQKVKFEFLYSFTRKNLIIYIGMS